MTRLFIVLLCLALGHCQTTATPPAPRPRTAGQQQLEKELRDADLSFSKATAERRLQGFLEFFASDAALVRNGKVITGQQSVRELYAPMFANPDFKLSWTPTKVESSKDGTLGYTYGDFEVRQGQEVRRGMYATIWRKQNDKWLVVLDTISQLTEQPKPAKGTGN